MGGTAARPLRQTGGDVTDDERSWADRILGTDAATDPSAA